MNIKFTSVVLGLSMFFALPAMADEYDDCMKDVSKNKGGDFEIAVCMKQQAAKLLKDVQTEYTTIANMKFFQKWNNGNGMFKGNIRDTYNAWLVYRNKYCDLYALATTERSGTEDYNREKCKMDMTEDQLAYVRTIIRNKNAVID